MRLRAAAADRWPEHLATFDPAGWPPARGEVEPSCGCDSCARFGRAQPARRTVAAARGRWRRARLAALSPGTPEFRAEALEALREGVVAHYENPE